LEFLNIQSEFQDLIYRYTLLHLKVEG
jgi:hypothetical protein